MMAGVDRRFVRVSRSDARYFELGDGTPFVPAGLNIAFPRGITDEAEGLRFYETYFDRLSENGGNFARIWLSHTFFDPEDRKSGEYRPEQLARIKAVLALAKTRGIRLKLTLEHFRTLDLERPLVNEIFPGAANFHKPLHHRQNGGLAETMPEFFTLPACRAAFKRKLRWYADAIGDDPTVFAWELWNEVNAVNAPIDAWFPWSEEMLEELHRLFPRNMAVQSLGSYDSLNSTWLYGKLSALPGNDFNQMHCYYDPGAEFDLCRGPMDLLCAGAMGALRELGPDKPSVLAEAGAVEWVHCAPSHLYLLDKGGILFHDALFAPFFAGAAGCGQFWHWEMYPGKYDLWHQYKRFTFALRHIHPQEEDFRPLRREDRRLRLHVLQGKRHTLVWCRDKHSAIEEVERQSPPPVLEAHRLFLPALLEKPYRTAEWYDPWTDTSVPLPCDAQELTLPAFRRSGVIRFSH